MEIKPSLPVHPSGPGGLDTTAAPCLRIDGLVARPVEVEGAILAALPRIEREEAFTCEEGWTVPNVRWGGVRLADVIALAGPRPSAPYVRVHAGEYVVPVTIAEAADALLCDELNGRPLPRVHGAPWRLVVPGRECFTSVKWVDRLELTDDPGEPTGERIARSQLAPRAGGRPQQEAP
jgi:DMSO/TMAO reductase YedYZ molybdopterin-dependent catalytic subunit